MSVNIASTSGPTYDHLPLARVISERANLLEQINQEVDALNLDFQTNPSKIDTETIKRLISNLRKINATIESKKQWYSDHPGCLGYVKTITWVVISFEILAWIGAATVGGLNIGAACKGGTPRNSLLITIAIISMFLSAVLARGIRAIDEDDDRFKLFAGIARIEQQGEENFQQFLEAFNQFKETVQGETLSKCIYFLDHMPQKGFKEKLLTRDCLISGMVQMLSDSDPIKIQFKDLKDALIERLSQEADCDTESIHSSVNPFKGEQLSFDQIDFSSRRHPLSPELPLPDQIRQVQSKEFKHDFLHKMHGIDDMLGTRIDCIEVDGVVFDRKCRVGKSLEQLHEASLQPQLYPLTEIVID